MAGDPCCRVEVLNSFWDITILDQNGSNNSDDITRLFTLSFQHTFNKIFQKKSSVIFYLTVDKSIRRFVERTIGPLEMKEKKYEIYFYISPLYYIYIYYLLYIFSIRRSERLHSIGVLLVAFKTEMLLDCWIIFYIETQIVLLTVRPVVCQTKLLMRITLKKTKKNSQTK